MSFTSTSNKHAPSRKRQRGFSLPLQRVARVQHDLRAAQAMDSQVAINNGHEFIYLIPINVGEQLFQVILDTGSSDLWLVSEDCKGLDCDGVSKYTSSSSTLSLSGQPFKLSYLLGSVTGSVATETVQFGPYQISSQTFGLATEVSSMSLSNSNNSGILGLAFPSQSAISRDSSQTILENIFSHFDGSARFFAFQLGRRSGPNDPTSSLTIGQLDTSIAPDMSGFYFSPVSRVGSDDYDYWKLPLRYLTINSTKFPLSPSRVHGAKDQIAVLDSGTTLALGPTADVDAFYSSVGDAAKKNDAGMWQVPCEKAFLVGFVFGVEGNEKEFMLDPGDISWEEGGYEGAWCMAGIQANDKVNSGDWLLGDVFLRNVYVTHHGANSSHPPTIGLLTTTNTSSALARFRRERGPDLGQLGSIQMRGATADKSPFTHAMTVYVISALCGFVGGAVLTLLFRVRRRRSSARKRRVVSSSRVS